MKKLLALLLCVFLFVSALCIETYAVDLSEKECMVIDFTLTDVYNKDFDDEINVRATGLIYSYGLQLTKSGTTLIISGATNCVPEVEKSGFKNLIVERRKNNSDSWEDYYEYGNVYIDSNFASLSTRLSVASGYQYRISCKHYAKKNILSVQTIANTSNIVVV